MQKILIRMKMQIQQTNQDHKKIIIGISVLIFVIFFEKQNE